MSWLISFLKCGTQVASPHQFLSDIMTSPTELATQIVFFSSITQEFEPLMPAQTVPNVIPSDLLVSVEEVSLVSGQRSLWQLDGFSYIHSFAAFS